MVKIVDLLQNEQDNVFAEIFSADASAYFAGKSTVKRFVQPMPPLFCKKIESPPYVCNICQLRKGCACNRAYYVATQAHDVAMRRYSETRSKPQTHGEDLEALDRLVAPLIKKVSKELPTKISVKTGLMKTF